MNTSFKKLKTLVLILAVCFFSFASFSQSAMSTWKAQVAFGVNSPSQGQFVSSFESNAVNLPTINLGVQRMFNPRMGAKLDYGYNRINNSSNSPDFKVNYSRINAQFVYDATVLMDFLPFQTAVVGHAGPGFSFVKPLGDYTDNKTSFLNVMAGIEFHYDVSEGVSVFLDTSYIYGFSGDYDTESDGYGTFNGNLFTATVGVSVSLSGCYFCN